MEKVIASRITEARESRALSMEDLAESINVTRQTVSKYEKGVVSPSPDVLLDISHTLDFPVDFIKTIQEMTRRIVPCFLDQIQLFEKKSESSL